MEKEKKENNNEEIMEIVSVISGRDIARIKTEVTLIEEFMRSVLKKDVDFGVIPGTSSKPTLFKSGAEFLLKLFKLRLIMEDLKIADDTLVYSVTIKVKILNKQGEELGFGIGMATSEEKKFQNQLKYKTLGDLKNTILKIAKKRAMVDAVLTCTAGSHFFTQDLEEELTPLPITEEEIKHASSLAPVSVPPNLNPPISEVSTPAQRSKIFTMFRELQMDEKIGKELLWQKTAKDSTKNLTKSEASNFIEFLTQIKEGKVDVSFNEEGKIIIGG